MSNQARANNIADLDSFLMVNPKDEPREMIVDFLTLETGMVNLNLRPFLIGKYPVTNEQYFRFIKATGYRPDDPSEYSYDLFLEHWEEKGYPPSDKRFHPVTFVSHDDALAYAKYVKGRLRPTPNGCLRP